MIETRRAHGVTYIKLDRPARRNALTAEALLALHEAIEGVTTPVAYLHGAGDAFCAGADFAAIAALETEEDASAFAGLGQEVMDTIEQTDVIVVAGIDGPARGGGVELALAADVRVATEAASFAETGVNVGLFGAWGGTIRLVEVIGLGHALDLSLTGRTISATEAKQIGLVSQLVEAPETVAIELATKPARSLRIIKQRLRDRGSYEAQLISEQEAFTDLIEAGASLPSVD